MAAIALHHAGAEFDVGSPASHVRGDGYGLGLPGFRDDLGLMLVELGVEHVVPDTPPFQHAAQRFRGVDGCGTDQDRTPTGVYLLDLVEDSVVLLPAGPVDQVFVVHAPDGLVGGYFHHVHTIDPEKLVRFRHRRTGHARQRVVHAKVILDSDGGDRAGFLLDFHAFLGLNGLVQAFGQAPAVHQAARKRVDQDDLAVLDHVVDVLLVNRVGLEQLVHVVDPFAAFGVQFLQLGFFLVLLRLGEARVGFDFHYALAEIGNDEELLIARREQFPALLVDLGVAGLFVHLEEEIIVQFRQLFLPDEITFHLLDQFLDAGLLLKFEQFLVLRHAPLRL